MRFPLRIPDKYFDEIVNIVVPDVIEESDRGKPAQVYKPYTIEIKRRKDRVYAYITYETDVPGAELKWFETLDLDKVAGIDVNVDRVAVSIVSKQGNLLKSKTFYCHELEYVRSGKRDHITGELAKEIIDYLSSQNVGGFVMEDIKWKQDHDTDKRFNRFTHNFAKTKLQKALVARGLKFGFKVKKVNPAYTSVIGRFKYSQKYGLSVHEAASFVIGRRGLGMEEKMPAALIQALRKKVKPHLIQTLGSMEESGGASAGGKKKRRFMAMLLHNIDTCKENHIRKMWNVLHKALCIKNQEIRLKEV